MSYQLYPEAGKEFVEAQRERLLAAAEEARAAASVKASRRSQGRLVLRKAVFVAGVVLALSLVLASLVLAASAGGGPAGPFLVM